MEKTYIVVGDNDFWYATLTCKEENLQSELETLKQQIKNGDFSDNEPSAASELYAYEAKKSGGIKVIEDKEFEEPLFSL